MEREKRELEHQATRDGLTGVYNRSKFSGLLLSEIGRVRRYPDPLSLIMFDVDHFKRINDLFGHAEGDSVLMGITDLVSLNVREQDIFARWGGEEFITLALESDVDGASNLAEKLRRKIETTKFGPIGTVTCSFGVTRFERGDSIESFVKRADSALYLAKKKGRNRVEVVL